MTLIASAPVISTPVASAFWRRLDLPGHETARIEKIDGAGWCLSGMAVFRHARGPASLIYLIDYDANWETTSCAVYGTIGARSVEYHITRQDGLWLLNESVMAGCDHLVDLNLSFSAATVLIPLKRVAIKPGETVALPAARLDIDTGLLTELPQVYTRRGVASVWYESPGFAPPVQLDLAPDGFVLHFPGLCEAEIAI